MLCIGAGGLGSPVAMYLAAAGVGTLGIVDFDVVDYSNLQRQILHGTPDVGRPKLQSAKDRAEGAEPARRGPDLRDGADVRQRAADLRGLRRDRRRHRQLPDAVPRERRLRAAGQAERLRQHLPVRGPGVGVRDEGRAVLPVPVSRAASAGAGAELRRGRRARRAAGIVGCIQANETIKLILGIGEPLIGRFLVFDALRMKFRELKLRKDPDCPVCGTHPTVTKLIDYEQFCGVAPAAAAPERQRAG